MQTTRGMAFNQSIPLHLPNTTEVFHWIHGLRSPRWTLFRIEVLVLLCTIFLVLLLLFGSRRRRSSNQVLKVTLWTANTLLYSLVSYTIGLMQSSSFKNELFPVWAVFLLLVFASVDSFSAFSLDDNENWKRHMVEQMIQTFWILWLITEYDAGESKFAFAVWVLSVAASVKLARRIRAFQLASRSFGLVKDDKVVADYMKYEHELSNHVDPVQMKGYKYLVVGEGKHILRQNVRQPDYVIRIDTTSDEVVTLEKIWQCKGRLLRPWGDPKGELKDICLSFALFRLLRRRFSGYDLAESHLQKTQDFICKGLVQDDERQYERAFQVIEDELAFLYDLFYTKYPLIFYSGYADAILSQILAGFGIWFLVLIFRHYQTPSADLSFVTSKGKNVDTLVTFIVVCLIGMLEIAQFGFYLTSNWVKLWLLCKYVTKPSLHNCASIEKTIRLICGWRRFKPKWENKIGQYSLLESFDYSPKNRRYKLVSKMFTEGFTDKIREGQKSSRPIRLPKEVKKAVVLSLRANNGRLTNGMSSLQLNGVSGELSWACKLETNTHEILVWHIATTLCEVAALQTDPDYHRIVARSLSGYCAYLVAFVLVLLPDHRYTTEFIFDKVVSEARGFLVGTTTLRMRYDRMMEMQVGEPGAETVFEKGVRLGKQLMESIEDERVRWKVMADYWTEMMLFVAPSDNAIAHAERLANGGEFVTHLWALLTHAGILEREADRELV